MSLTGKIDFIGTIAPPLPNGLFGQIGEDGKHYLAPSQFGGVFNAAMVGCGEDNSIAASVTSGQWQTDLAARTLGTSGTYNFRTVVPFKGTSRVMLLGGGQLGSANEDHVVGVIYNCVDNVTFNPVGGFFNVAGSAATSLKSFNGSGFTNCYGTVVAGTDAFAVINPATKPNYLAKLPMTGDTVDVTIGSWDNRLTTLPWEWQFFVSASPRQYYSRAGLIALPSGNIGVLPYIGKPEWDARNIATTSPTIQALSGPALLYSEVDPDARTATASQDLSSSFLIPFTDSGKLFSGSTDSSGRGDYSAPDILPNGEVLFLRGYEDNRQWVSIYQFKMLAADDITYIGRTVAQVFTSDIVSLASNIEYATAFRAEGDDNIQVAARDSRYYWLGETPLAPPPGPEIVIPEVIMPEPIALVDGGREPTLRQRLVNMYSEPTPKGPTDFSRYQRPGLYSVAVRGDGPIRKTFLWNLFRITVSGTEVYRDSTLIGSIEGTGSLRFAFSDEEMVLVSGGKAWYVTLTDVAHITDPDLPDNVIDVAFLAGRFIYLTGGTSEFRWSAINDARTIDGFDFSTAAENTADHLVGLEVLVDQLVFFTAKVIEWWYPQDDAAAPFRRSPGRKNDQGLASIQSVVLLDNALIFLGTDKMIYRSGSVPLRISDWEVDDHIRRVTIEDLANAYAFGVVFGGHTFYVIFLPGEGSWAYDIAMKQWAEWKSWGKDRFRVLCADENYCGDNYSGIIMGLDGAVFTDLGDPIERVVSAFIPQKSGSINNFNVCLNCIRGVGLPSGYGSAPVVEMRFADDEAHTWCNWREATLGAEGQRTDAAKAIWHFLGEIRAPGRAFEFRCSDPVKFSPYQLLFNQPRP